MAFILYCYPQFGGGKSNIAIAILVNFTFWFWPNYNEFLSSSTYIIENIDLKFLSFTLFVFKEWFLSYYLSTYFPIWTGCKLRYFYSIWLYCDNIVDEDGSSDDRKKRPRTAFTAAQIKALEQEFERNKYLSVSKRLQLSKHLKLTETQVS
jgi:BarH-like protein